MTIRWVHYISYLLHHTHKNTTEGSACVGIRSSTHCVLGELKRSVSSLSTHQKKLLPIDTHMGIGIAGLTADARTLAKWMRSECLNHKYVYGTDMPTGRLMTDLADRHQRTTQTYVRRPYGVGLLVASYDKTGPHLYQTCPSGNVYEYYASAIGARSQSGRTYLEKHHGESVADATVDDLIMHALRALAGCVSTDDKEAKAKGNAEGLTADNASVGIVGKDQVFRLMEGAELQPYLDRLELEGGAAGGNDDDGDGGDGGDGEAPTKMET